MQRVSTGQLAMPLTFLGTVLIFLCTAALWFYSPQPIIVHNNNHHHYYNTDSPNAGDEQPPIHYSRIQHRPSAQKHLSSYTVQDTHSENVTDNDPSVMFYNPWSKASSDFKDPETPPDSLPSDPYAQYIYHEELDVSQYPSLARGKKPRRTIVVGDIHGHLQGFNDFLQQVRHDPAKDILVLAGDLVAKGPQTLAVIDRAIELNARCVRGNHDDKVIRWRGFLDSLSLQERNALDVQQGNLDDDEVHDEVHEDDDEEEEEDENADLDEDLRAKVPSDLHRNSEHYRIARAMTQSQYDYIRSCPLILTLPRTLSVHHIPVHVVHAGIDPRRDILHQRPWVLFNVRNLLKDGTPSRKKKKGQGWARAFNRLHTKRSPKAQDFLVLYGHDAGRSLNVRTWSIGIDTGCVYGRKLTGYMVETGQLHSVDCIRNQRK